MKILSPQLNQQGRERKNQMSDSDFEICETDGGFLLFVNDQFHFAKTQSELFKIIGE